MINNIIYDNNIDIFVFKDKFMLIKVIKVIKFQINY